jgi:hypothetical protein
MNTLFNYRYCDASGYSSWGDVVFGGVFDEALLARMRRAFEGGEFFVADQVRVPQLFFETSSIDDHCFHAFSRLEITDAAVSDPHDRSIEAFVAEVEAAASAGWKMFDPFAERHSRVIR